MNNPRLHSLLRGRGMTLTRLAAEAGVSRPHLSRSLEGRPGRGAQVRRKVARLLTAAERACLGMDGEGKVEQVEGLKG